MTDLLQSIFMTCGCALGLHYDSSGLGIPSWNYLNNRHRSYAIWLFSKWATTDLNSRDKFNRLSGQTWPSIWTKDRTGQMTVKSSTETIFAFKVGCIASFCSYSIVEGMNLNTNNQMTVHTRSGCTHVATSNQTGRLLETDCSTDAGCTVADSSTASYGDAFNKAGGVRATQFTADE